MLEQRPAFDGKAACLASRAAKRARLALPFICVALAGAAGAQEDSAAATPRLLEEVVTTASKKGVAEAAQDVVGAVSVIDGARLDALHVNGHRGTRLLAPQRCLRWHRHRQGHRQLLDPRHGRRRLHPLDRPHRRRIRRRDVFGRQLRRHHGHARSRSRGSAARSAGPLVRPQRDRRRRAAALASAVRRILRLRIGASVERSGDPSGRERQNTASWEAPSTPG